MRCPKCGSEDWRYIPWAYPFMVGLGTASCGLWLVLLIIGIPIVIAGLLISAVSPFAGSRYVCKRCNTSWKKPKQT